MCAQSTPTPLPAPLLHGENQDSEWGTACPGAQGQSLSSHLVSRVLTEGLKFTLWLIFFTEFIISEPLSPGVQGKGLQPHDLGQVA